MKPNSENRAESTPHKKWVPALFCLVVLAAGVAGMGALGGQKTVPEKKGRAAAPLSVTTVTAKAGDAQVFLSGFGEAHALKSAIISPEVSGVVTKIHPLLEEGSVVDKGEVLFAIDSRDYKAAQKSAEIQVKQYENKISQLKVELERVVERTSVISRSTELSRSEYLRLKELYTTERVGTLSAVEAAEKSWNTLVDSLVQLKQSLDLYPLKIQEAENSLEAAKSDFETASLNVSRCVVTAPFTGRIKSVSLEEKQYVSPGTSVVTMADDSVLEIQVPMNSGDVAGWIRFDSNEKSAGWFDGLEKIDCDVGIAGDGPEIWQTGEISRIVKFDPQTRTTVIAVHIKRDKTSLSNQQVVDGMFCNVRIPGKTLKRVYWLPAQAVSADSTVFLARGEHLKTVPVTVARKDGDSVYISEGLSDGDQVIVSRLINPLENALVSVKPSKNAGPDQVAFISRNSPK